MLFRVWNLGPIREAELDLSKDLIVLTGPNNTGKTYLTWAVYGLTRPAVIPEPEGGLVDWLREWIREGGASRRISEFSDQFEGLIHSLEADLLGRLPDTFAAPAERFRGTRVEFGVYIDDFKRLAREPMTRRFPGPFTIEFEHDTVRLVPLKGVSPSVLKSLPDSLGTAILVWATLGLLEAGATVFPVERLAINLFARELAAQRTALVDDLVDQLATGAKEDSLQVSLRRVGRYPRVIRDALQRALKLRAVEAGPFADLAEALERDVLGGKLSKSEYDELQFKPDASTDARPIGLHQSASVIKSLASLVWHLRHEAHAGERLIIDEPELNLHPDNQRRVARVLAKAVNRGLRLMLSTHSDYFVRELNNLIMLSQDSDAARGLVKEMGIDPLSTIKPERLGVYLVNDGTCTPVPVTETGFEVKTIDEEIHRLNRDSQTIYSRLFCE